MIAEVFENIVLERQAKTRAKLLEKSKEYADDQERLYNFKRAARMANGLEGLSSAGAAESLRGMLIKHWVSIEQIVAIYEAMGTVDERLLDEKLGDAVAYLHLLEAIIKERH
jgi:hypothetical protein